MNNKSINNLRQAFTLIELLIVVAIIAILAAIAVPNFIEAQVRSKVSRAKADMRTLVTAVESYAVDQNSYPYGQGCWKFWAPGNVPNVNHNPAYSPLMVLTSPVAYIATLPNVVFNQDPTVPTAIWPMLTFWYLNRQFRVDNWGSTMGWTDPDWLSRGYSEYVMMTDGPSGQLGNFTYNTEVRYDPTNGTVSIGGIYFGGPGGNNS